MKNFKSPIIWATAFFGTLWAFSVGYSAFVTSYPSTAASGSGLSASEWNKIAPALQALDSGLSNFSFLNGNVGIGTATPGNKLDVVGPDSVVVRAHANDAAGNGVAMFHISNTKWGQMFNMQTWQNTDVIMNVTSNHPLSFRTNNTERARISATGNVGIGTVNPDHKLHVAGDIRLDTGYAFRFWALSENSDDTYIRRVNTATDVTDLRLYIHDNSQEGDRFSIWWASCDGGACGSEAASSVRHYFATSGNAWHLGAVNASSFNNTSDARLKKNVAGITDALDKVSAMRGVTFEWKDPERGTGSQVGFIAQEVEKVEPALVRTNEDGYKSVQYANVSALLVEAVKELKQENSELKKRIEVLESAK